MNFFRAFALWCILLATVFLTSVPPAHTQTAGQRQKIKEATNVKRLRELSRQFEAEEEASYARARELARQNNWPLQYRDRRNNPVYLIGVDEELGYPIYIKPDNLDAAVTTRTDKIWRGGGAGYNLTGDSMLVGVWDGGLVLTSHREFGSRVTQSDGNNTLSYHATHVTGTIVAEGIDSEAKGMAYEANANTYSFFNDDSEMATEASNGLLLSNHSYGTPAGWEYDRSNNRWLWHGIEQIDSMEDFRFGYYNRQASNWDEIAHNAPYYLIVKSAGNDRSNDLPSNVNTYYLPNDGYAASTRSRAPDGNYDCLPTYSTAKNILTVGATRDVNQYTGPSSVNITSFSSWGPTDDGRIKPDIVGNGSSVYSTSDVGSSSYDRSSGTSMSAPNVTGSLLLLQQLYFRRNNSYMRAATLKGLALHTADEAGQKGPDYAHGWGLLNSRKAADALSDTSGRYRIAENTLLEGDTLKQRLYANGREPVRLTICWTDPEAAAQSAVLNNRNAKVLINDLDLRLVHESSQTVYQPYVLDPDNPAQAATRGDNDVDNVEQVYLENAPSGTYTIKVYHKGNLQNAAPQDYAMISEGFYGTPQPSFRASTNSACRNEAVNFTNLTSGATSSLVWYFPGGTPDSSTQQRPDVRYAQSGQYDVRLKVTNALGTQSLVKENLISVEPDENGVSAINMGASSTYLAVGVNQSNKLVYEPQTDALAFLHNRSFSFGGTGGALHLDYSTDGGQSWDTQMGPINANQGNLPFVADLAPFNPAGNTQADSLRWVLSSPLFNAQQRGFRGHFYGVHPFDSLKPSFLRKQEGANTNLRFPQSLVQSDDSTYWLIDAAAASSGQVYIFKGEYDALQDTIGFRQMVNYTMNLDTPDGAVRSAKIDFGPNGRYGWAVVMANLSDGPNGLANYPVVMATSDAGLTWSQPESIRLDSLLAVRDALLGKRPYAGSAFGMTVDSAGQLHLLMEVSPQNGSALDSAQPSNIVHVYGNPQQWRSKGLGQRRRFIRDIGNNNALSVAGRPQMARNQDGTLMAFTWVSATQSGSAYDPQLMGKAFNLQTGKYTRNYNFTRCQNADVNGQMFLVTAARLLKEDATHITLPVVTSSSVNGNFNQGVNHRYIDSIRFPLSEMDFKVPIAGFDIAQQELCANQTAAFVDQTQQDVTRWKWVLPGTEDTIYTEQNPLPSYVRAGTFDAMLIATSPAGVDTLRRSDAITVKDTPAFTINADRFLICQGDTAVLTVTANGNTGLTPGTGLVSSSAGRYAVAPVTDQTYRLQVTENGCRSQQVVVVEVGGDEPISGTFNADNFVGCDTLTVNFEGNTNKGRNFTWTFEGGDPASSNEQSPQVVYDEPGTYDVRLKVDDGCGREDQIFRARYLRIESAPEISLFPTRDTLIEKGDTVALRALSSGNLTWLDGPDIVKRGDTSITVSPQEDIQTYTAVATQRFCPDDTADIRIFTDPSVGFGALHVQDNRWQVYPNPAQKQLHISPLSGTYTKPITWQLRALDGRLMSTGHATGAVAIPVERFAKGLYMLSISDEASARHLRVLIR